MTDHRPDLQLKIPTNRVNFDAGCDQGYGSERSPEDEMPPTMPLMMDGNYDDFLSSTGYNHVNWGLTANDYNFITKGEFFFLILNI